jgi:release factor glutamine methyltransferase
MIDLYRESESDGPMGASVRVALASGAARLAAAGVPDPARDARLLLAEALGLAPDRIVLSADAGVDAAAAAAFAAYLDQRARFRPVAQILGRRAFWGRDFAVTADVLDPRPETEVLVACALEGPPPAAVLDLGTGSGAILVTLLAEWPEARGLGTDVSAAALAVAERNAARHGVAARAEFRRADWTEGLAGRFDLVVSNPPYVAGAEMAGLSRDVRDWEPALALTPGPTGLESYRRIAAGLGRVLAPEGRALVEIGAGQGGAVTAIFRGAGFTAEVRPDLDGRDRVVVIGQ